MRAISLCLHDILDVEQTKRGDVYTLKLAELAEHLRMIEQYRAAVRTIPTSVESEIQPPVFITFDDGTSGAYVYASELLEKHGWRGHFFITTDWIGHHGFMDRRQIVDLHKRGHIVGSHTCSHPERMSHLTDQELVREWTESCSILSDIAGFAVNTASVAGGYYSRRVAEAAASVGIRALFNSEPTSKTHFVGACLVLGRYSIQSFTAPGVTAAIAAGHRWPRWRQTLLWDAKKVLKLLAGESYVTARRQLLSRLTSR